MLLHGLVMLSDAPSCWQMMIVLLAYQSQYLKKAHCHWLYAWIHATEYDSDNPQRWIPLIPLRSRLQHSRTLEKTPTVPRESYFCHFCQLKFWNASLSYWRSPSLPTTKSNFWWKWKTIFVSCVLIPARPKYCLDQMLVSLQVSQFTSLLVVDG